MLYVKRIILSVLKLLGYQKKNKKTEYKIGNLKHHNARIDALTPRLIEIGDDFVSAPGAIVLSHDASPFQHIGKYRVEKTKIGNRVFLGANSVVLAGVTIGDNVIVGAGAVVTKSVESGSVVAGNPAKVICTINEYFVKCESRSVLYKAPIDFDIMKQDGRPSAKSVVKFQEDIIKRMNNER